MDISIIVPVYNGELTLKDLYFNINKALDGLFSYEIIFVYDSGWDRSWETIKEIASENRGLVHGFYLDKNYGQHQATLYGFKKVTGDYIITLDEDSQHDPKYIPDLITKLINEKLDFVYGKYIKIQQPFLKVLLSKILRLVLSSLIPKLPFDYSSFRLIRKELAVKITDVGTHLLFIDAELGNISVNYGILFMDHLKRTKGTSSYTLNKLFKQSVDILFRYSNLFGVIYTAFLILFLVAATASFFLMMYFPVISYVIPIVLIMILFSMILLRVKSNKRIKCKLNPVAIEYIN